MDKLPDATQTRLIQMYLRALREMVIFSHEEGDESELINIYKFTLITHLKANRFLLLIDQEGEWMETASYGINVVKDYSALLELVSTIRRASPLDLPTLKETPLGQFTYVVPTIFKAKNQGLTDADRPIAWLFINVEAEGFLEQNPSLVEFLETITYTVNIAIYNRRVRESESSRKAFQLELNLASKVQNGLYPKRLPQTGPITAAAERIAHVSVSGDYYDLIDIGKGRYLMCIADVSGKGFSAALLMANFQATLRTLSGLETDLRQIVDRLNELTCVNGQGDRFVTSFLAIIDTQNNTLEYVNAGHHPPVLVFDTGHSVLLNSNTTILGIFSPLPSFQSAQVNMPLGSMLLTYTDGVVETFDKDGNEYGTQRLQQLMNSHNAYTPDELNALLMDRLNDHRKDVAFHDDITIFTLKRNTEPAQS